MFGYVLGVGPKELDRIGQSQTTLNRNAAEKYLNISDAPARQRDLHLDLFARTFGYKDFKAMEPDLCSYKSFDDFISNNTNRIVLPHDQLIRQDAPETLRKSQDGRRASRRELDRCFGNGTVDHGAVLDEHVRGSRGRIDSLSRTRGHLEHSRRSLRERGALPSDERFRQLDDLIADCDSQITEEARLLMDMVVMSKEKGLALTGQMRESFSLIRAYVDKYGLTAFSKELEGFLKEQGVFGHLLNSALLFMQPSTKQNGLDFWELRNDPKFQSPYAYWLDPKQQEKEIAEWKEMIQAIYKKNDEFKLIIREYNWKLDLARMANMPDLDKELAAAVIRMQTPSKGV